MEEAWSRFARGDRVDAFKEIRLACVPSKRDSGLLITIHESGMHLLTEG